MSPIYVFVGGVSHTLVFFEKVIKELATSGVKSIAVAYPTCGDHTENTKQWDEVTAIQEAVVNILDTGSDVVLVLHSYGGWPGSRAIKGLDKETRSINGKSTGIVEVVFIAAFLIPDNAPMATYSYLPPWLTVENGQRIPNEDCMPLLFSDLDAQSQRYWLSQFAWHRNDFTAETIPDAPWHLSVPKTCIITVPDQGATIDFQFQMIQSVMKERPETWTFKSIASGHEPFISQPETLARILLQPSF